MRNKVQTGISGLDKMLDGGIPEGNQIILAGGPGTGKTLLLFEYLYKNAINGKTSILFSLEEDTDMIVENAKEAFPDFKDIDTLISAQKLIIRGASENKQFIQKESESSAYTFGRMIMEIESFIDSVQATRVGIDSVSLIKLFIKDVFEYRNVSTSLVSLLRKLGVTAFLSMEIDTPEKDRLLFEPEFFIYDGIITMYSGGDESDSRILTMEVIKMRGSKHSFSTIPYEITPSGISIMLLPERKQD